MRTEREGRQSGWKAYHAMVHPSMDSLSCLAEWSPTTQSDAKTKTLRLFYRFYVAIIPQIPWWCRSCKLPGIPVHQEKSSTYDFFHQPLYIVIPWGALHHFKLGPSSALIRFSRVESTSSSLLLKKIPRLEVIDICRHPISTVMMLCMSWRKLLGPPSPSMM